MMVDTQNNCYGIAFEFTVWVKYFLDHGKGGGGAKLPEMDLRGEIKVTACLKYIVNFE